MKRKMNRKQRIMSVAMGLCFFLGAILITGALWCRFAEWTVGIPYTFWNALLSFGMFVVLALVTLFLILVAIAALVFIKGGIRNERPRTHR